MSSLILAAYNLAWYCATPFGRWWLSARAAHRPLSARFVPPDCDPDSSPIWIQACSVGEVNTAAPLIAMLRQRMPEQAVLLTASTVAGHAHARAQIEDGFAGQPVSVAWFPFDAPGSVRRFIGRMRPAALILVETELWPNVLHHCERAAIPVVIVNGRLSDRHIGRYRRLRPLLRPLLQSLARAGMQSDAHASRLRELGVDAEKVAVTGNMKFDSATTDIDARTRVRVRAENGIPPTAPVLVFGSTRPGDEALASACWTTLREEHPDLHLVIVPRHIDRAEEIRALFSEPVTRRSALAKGGAAERGRVVLVDTLGDLMNFYAVATVAVVGGSVYPGVEGHNPIEPAALGVPTLFGTHMRNFEEPARILLDARGARQVSCPEDLYPAIADLLAHSAEQRQMGTRARKAVLQHRGATERNVALIESVLSEASGKPAAIR